jgi:7-cyano-7-deazaguanine synthase
MKQKACLIFSGGIDSTTLLYKLLDEGKEVSTVTFNYGQRHRPELEAAHTILQLLKLRGQGLNLNQAPGFNEFMRGSSQVDTRIAVPEGHYADPSMKTTVVPNRNMVMLALAAAYCVSHDIHQLSYAAHAGDHAIYPDCRPAFVTAMDTALAQALYAEQSVVLDTPFLTWSKANIVEWGHVHDVPFQLTYSCYNGRPHHCGRCGTCVERREAFRLAGVNDPTTYENSVYNDTK